MSSLEELARLEAEATSSTGLDGAGGGSGGQQAQEDELDAEVLRLSTDELKNRTRLLDNDIKIMRSEYQRLSHEQGTMRERIKDNEEKIANNRYATDTSAIFPCPTDNPLLIDSYLTLSVT